MDEQEKHKSANQGLPAAPDLADRKGDSPDLSGESINCGIIYSTSAIHDGAVFPRGMWEPPKQDLGVTKDRFDAIVAKVLEINQERCIFPFPEEASVVVRMVFQAMAEVDYDLIWARHSMEHDGK